MKLGLSRFRKIGTLQQREDFLLTRAVEDRRRDVHAGERFLGELVDIGLGEGVDKVVTLFLGIDFLEPLFELRGADPVLEVFFDFMPELARGPSEMSFEDLPDVHSRRHSKWVQHDIHRSSVRQ